MKKNEKMKIKTKQKNNIWIVEIDGPIKSGMEFDLADELESILHQTEVPKIVIEMR